MILNSDLCSTSVTAVLCAISYNFERCYNCTRLCASKFEGRLSESSHGLVIYLHEEKESQRFCCRCGQIARCFLIIIYTTYCFSLLWQPHICLSHNMFLLCYCMCCYSVMGVWVAKMCNIIFPSMLFSGIILCMRPANERRRYIVASSVIGWAHAQDRWVSARKT